MKVSYRRGIGRKEWVSMVKNKKELFNMGPFDKGIIYTDDQRKLVNVRQKENHVNLSGVKHDSSEIGVRQVGDSSQRKMTKKKIVL